MKRNFSMSSPRCIVRAVPKKPIIVSLQPEFVTGFSDAEACFKIPIIQSNRCKIGYQVQANMQICLHVKDLQLLYLIQSHFGVGNINKGKTTTTAYYTVANLKDLVDVIIPHFEKNPLMTQKRSDFELFRQALELIQNKEHLTIEGLQKILNLKASINKGISVALKAAFPDVIPVPRPLVVDQEIKVLHPN